VVPEHEQSLPPFQILASTLGFLSEEEMDRLIADHVALLTEGKLGTGTTNADLRRSQIVFLKNEPRYRWLYERLWAAVQECNRRFFCVDIYGIEGNIQLARYDSSEQGFYDWHTDFADLAPLRKISVSIQLSRPEDYEGGDLELLFKSQPVKAIRTRGSLIAFPSFAVHRVTPVTRGTRWSLVAWIVGTRWR
jgi:predicted 2-oxoglutarate/Fe(II)-dependent dioxygenase YbiX